MMLARPGLATYDSVYELVRREPLHRRQAVPTKVLSEFAVAMSLVPLLGVQFDRPYAPMILASDASPEYGFGKRCVRVSARCSYGVGPSARTQR